MTAAASDTLKVQILSAKGIIWEGTAESVSSVNSQGPFDLLPQHAHFVSLIEHTPITVVEAGKERSFTFTSAVVRLYDDVVTVYADIG